MHIPGGELADVSEFSVVEDTEARLLVIACAVREEDALDSLRLRFKSFRKEDESVMSVYMR